MPHAEDTMTRGRTITVYLASGTVTGIRHAELDNWSGQAVSCPRSRADELSTWEQAVRPGVYFLIGAEGEGDRKVYVGESENVADRLKDHIRKKEFWQEVVLFTSKDDNLTKAHVKYLEHRLIEEVKLVGRCALQNDAGSNRPKLPRSQADAMEGFIDNARVLIGALGHRFLTPLDSRGTSEDDEDAVELSYKIKGAVARGRVTDEGFLVYADSRALDRSGPTLGTGNQGVKRQLREAEKLVPEGSFLRFTENVLFNTPSQAASIISGKAANGRRDWKAEDGRSLKQVEEEPLASNQDHEGASTTSEAR